MNLTLIRKFKNGDAIIGELLLDGVRQCYTLERLSVAIPTGTYKIELTFSPHFHQLMPLLDVPHREGIRIHPANYPKQLEGCIAPGLSFNQDSVNNSNAAFEPLFAKIKAAIDTWQDVSISVSEAG